MTRTTDGTARVTPDRVREHYDSLGGDDANLHFGYWPDGGSGGPYAEAAERLTDLVLAKLAVTGRRRVLDVGCGVGAPAVRLAAAGSASVVGVSVSPRQVERASARAAAAGLADRVEFRLADALCTGLPDDSFDAAFALESLPHMDRAAALRELARVVRPGGRIVLTDLVRRAPAAPGGPDLMDILVQVGVMARPVSVEDYPALLREAGLRALETADLGARTLPGTFAEMLARFEAAIATGDVDSLGPTAMDLTLPENQQAVRWFAREMTGTEEVGYLLVVATVDR